jgi:uncharacterized protein
MRPRSPFLHSVADLDLDRSPRRDVLITVPVDWAIELSRLEPDPPLEADLTLTRTRGGVIVTGRVDADVRHVCPRCLEERIEPIEIEVAQLVADPSADDDVDEPPEYLLDGDTVDLEPVLRDETLLALPLLPVCPGGCSELVEATETDLNTDVPGDESRDSSPFAVLQDLIEHAD